MDRKKIIIISAVVTLVLIIGLIVFLFLRSGGTTGEGGFLGLFPRGTEKEIGGGKTEETLPAEGEEKILTQLTNFPIAGATTASSTAGALIRYIEKSTGHIYETSPQGKDRNRLSNTTILKTFESFWSPVGNKAVLRYFDDDNKLVNFSVRLNVASSSVEGVFLSRDLVGLAASPVEEKIFYIQKTDEVGYGFVSDFENKKATNIFSLPFTEFNINWPAKDEISLLTKPSNGITGYLYLLNIKTKEFRRIMEGKKGLTALVSPDAESVLYSESSGDSTATEVFNAQERSTNYINLGIIPDNSVWSKKETDIVYCGVPVDAPSAIYPDDWYKGKVLFNDSIVRIDTSVSGGDNITLLESSMEVINLFLTPDENYLIFTNKKDLSLWSLKIKQWQEDRI